MKKYITVVVLAVIFMASCSIPMLPDEYYDARLEGTWIQDTPLPGSYKTLTFNGIGGEFIGDVEGTGLVEGYWTAHGGVDGGTLSISFSDIEHYAYDYIFDEYGMLTLIPIGASEGFTNGIEGGLYHR